MHDPVFPLWTAEAYAKELLASLPTDTTQLANATVPTEKLIAHGTTIGALRVDGGTKVVAFSDGKVSMDHIAFNTQLDKVLQVDDHSCLLISGSLASGIRVARALRSNTAVRQNVDQRPYAVSSKVNFLSEAIYKLYPMAAHGLGLMPLFATFDKGYSNEGRIYSFGYDGSFQPEERQVLGSGFIAGNAILEDRYDEAMQTHGDVSLSDGLSIAERVLAKTAADDNASGGSWTIKVISAEGVQTVRQGGA